MDIGTMAGHAIRRLHQVSTRLFTSQLTAAGFDLTPVQFAALAAIHDHPDKDQAAIAALIAYDKATIGGVMDRLDKKGLVDRVSNPKDKRARLVRLTQEGRKLLLSAYPTVRDLQQDILAGLDPEEQSQFTALALKAARYYDSE